MSGTTDKIAGKANAAIGNIKQGIGKVIGSTELEAKGKAQEIKGEAQQAMGSVKEKASEAIDSAKSSGVADTVKGYANQAVGKAQEVAGRATGSPQTEAEGLEKQAKAAAQKAAGNIKRDAGV